MATPQIVVEDLRPQLAQQKVIQAQMVNSFPQQTLMAMQAKMDNSQQRQSMPRMDTRNITPSIQRLAKNEKQHSDFSGPRPAENSTIQRMLVPFKTPAAANADQTNIITDANVIEGITNAAYVNTWNRLNAATLPGAAVPLAQAQFPGVTNGHFAHFVNTMAGNNGALKAAAVGYVIEDQVTHNGALPATAAPQTPSGNAILDFVITRNAERGIVDITSTGQAGHVLNKSFTKGPFSYIGESMYQSIDFTQLNGGAAPQIGVAAAALALAAKRQRANNFIGSQLNQLKQSIELYKMGIKHNDGGFEMESNTVVEGINALPNGAYPPADIIQLDLDIATMNLGLGAAFQLNTLTQIITAAQNNYLLAGNPMW
ncbi:hypothetical protein [Solimicrobium silvestre]|nr:hypothetical protein [Solimicrobium silvestre]